MAIQARNVPVRFIVNDKEFQAALKTSTQAMGKLDEAYKDVVAAQKEQLKTEGRLTKSGKDVYKEQVKMLVKLKDLPKAVEKQANEFLKLSESLRMAEQAQKQWTKSQGQAKLDKAVANVKFYGEKLEALRHEMALNIAQSNHMGKTLAKAGTELKGVGTRAKSAEREIKGLSGVINDVSFKLFVLTFAGKQVFDTLLEGFVKVGEKIILFESRVEALTGSTAAIQPLYGVVQDLGVGIDDASQAFTRFAVANNVMKRTQQELVDMTETVLAFGLAGGASVQEVTAGLQQLGQGLASNRLQGDELRSVLENLPVLAVALADELAGGSVAALRKMGEEGELVGEKISGALLKARERALELVEALPDTTERATARMSNAWDLMIAEMLKAVGGTSSVTDMFNNMAREFEGFASTISRNGETIRDVLEGVRFGAVTMLTVFAGQQVFKFKQGMANIITDMKAAESAAKAAGLSFSRLGYIMKWNLLSVVASVAVALGTTLVQSFRDSRFEIDAATESLDAFLERINRLEAAQLRQERAELLPAFNAKLDELRGAVRAYEQIRNTGPNLLVGPDGRMIQDLEAFQQRVDSARSAVAYAAQELDPWKEKLMAVERRLAELSGEAQDMIDRAKEAADATEEMTKAQDDLVKVLEKLNPELREQREYLEDMNTLFDAMNAGNAETIFQAMEDLDMRRTNSQLKDTIELIKKFENFRPDAYWDVDAYRTGFGSDTTTSIDNIVSKVTQETRVTVQDAERDLIRRLTTEFVPSVINAVGQEVWDELTSMQQAVLTSLAYNYGAGAWDGALFQVAEAVRSRELGRAVKEIEALAARHSQINADRRLKEAKLFAGLDVEFGKAAESAKDADKEIQYLADTVKTITDLSNKYLAEVKQLEEDQKALGFSTEELAQKQEILFRRYQNQVESLAKSNPQYQLRLANQKEEADNLAKLAKEAKKSEDAASDMEKIWTGALEEMGRSIQSNLADAFSETFADILGLTEDNMNRWQKMMLDIISQTAAQIAQQKIVMPIVNTVFGGDSGGGLFSGGGLTGNPNTNIFSAANNIFSGGGLTGNPNTSIFSSAGNLFGIGKAASSVGNLFTGGKAAYSAAYGASELAAGAGINLAGGAAGTSVGASVATGTAAAQAATGLSGLAAAASAATPYIAAAVAVASMLGVFGGKDKKFPGARIGVSNGRITALDAQDMPDADAAAFLKQIDQMNDALLEFAESLGDEAVEALKNWNKSGRDMAAGYIGENLERWFQEGLKVAVQGIRSSDGLWGNGSEAKYLRRMTEGVAPEQFLQAWKAAEAALVELGQVFGLLRTGAGQTTEQIAGFALAVQDAGASAQALLSLANYIDSLRTPVEQFENVSARLDQILSGVNVQLPQTERELVALVDGLDLTSEEGIKVANALGVAAPLLKQYYELQEALTPAVEDASAATEDLTSATETLAETARSAEDILRERENLELQLLRLLGDTDEIRRRELLALDASNRSLQERIWALEDAAEADRAAAQAAEEAAREAERIADTVAGFEEWLKGPLTLEDAMSQLGPIFDDFGVKVPTSKDQLREWLNTVSLTDAEIVSLSDNMDALNVVFGEIAAKVAGFNEWLKGPLTFEDAMSQLGPIFDDFGVKIPSTKDQLREWLNTVSLTDAEIASLSDNMDAFNVVFAETDRLAQEAAAAWEKYQQDLAAELERRAQEEMALREKNEADKYNLTLRYLRLTGQEQEAVNMEREKEIEGYSEENKALALTVFALEDLRAAREAEIAAAREQVEAIYEQQITTARANADAITAAIRAEYDAKLEGYQDQLSAAQEYASELSSIAGTIESAIRGIVGANEDLARIERARAVRDLAALAASGRVPGADEIERIAEGLSGASGLYQNRREALVGEATLAGQLRQVGGRVSPELEAAQAQVELLQDQIELLSDWQDAQLEAAQAALDKQLEAASEWRDAELERLDGLLDNLEIAVPEIEPIRLATEESLEKQDELRETIVEGNTWILQSLERLTAAQERAAAATTRLAVEQARANFIAEQAA